MFFFLFYMFYIISVYDEIDQVFPPVTGVLHEASVLFQTSETNL